MKANEIVSGHVYEIRHHDGFLHKVKVLCEKSVNCYGRVGGFNNPVRRTHYLCVKLSTGRTIEVKSAAKFRREIPESNNGQA